MRVCAASRGFSLAELMLSITMATVLIGVHVGELRRQQVVLAATTAESGARSALLAAYERLQAGVVTPPGEGETRTVRHERGITLRIARPQAPLDPRLQQADLVPVVLRVEWRGPAGVVHREMTTLVRRGGRR